MMRALRRSLAMLGVAATLAVSDCGSDDGGGAQEATLVLDFVPNAVHAGIYRALEAGYYEDEGLDLRIIQPTATADTLKLLEAGKANVGLADAIDVATQIGQGRDLRAVMAVLERPAGGVITAADSGIERPRELERREVGITGVPSDNAVLNTIVAGDGGDPSAVDETTIGFKGVQALEAGSIDAFTGFVGDAVQVAHDGVAVRSFRLDRFGGPSYPGLVAFSTDREIAADPELIRGFVDATVHGYADTLEDPGRSIDALVDENPEIDRGLATASLRAYLPLMLPMPATRTESGSAARGLPRPSRGFPAGSFDLDDLREFSRWLVDTGLTESRLAPHLLATNRFIDAR
jgi:putative hydroxymethylpyrimidine transport system substrate-binding protein